MSLLDSKVGRIKFSFKVIQLMALCKEFGAFGNTFLIQTGDFKETSFLQVIISNFSRIIKVKASCPSLSFDRFGKDFLVF